jgi:hypothetical protein
MQAFILVPSRRLLTENPFYHFKHVRNAGTRLFKSNVPTVCPPVRPPAYLSRYNNNKNSRTAEWNFIKSGTLAFCIKMAESYV